MTQAGTTLFSIGCEIKGLQPTDAIDFFVEEAPDHDLEVEEVASTQYRISSPFGVIDLEFAQLPLKMNLSSASSERLYMLKETMDFHFGNQGGMLADETQPTDLIWSGNLFQDPFPPNFVEGEVLRSTRVSENFQRVRITGEKIERYFEEAMHFKLLYPQKSGRAPVWPEVDENGRTLWPTGEDELARPVYTVHTVNEQKRYLEFDVYLHEGGPTALWAQNLKTGDKIGLMGPAGGEMPKVASLCMIGDETALPAIARILKGLSPDVTGQVIIHVGDLRDEQKLDAPVGMNVRWLPRADGNYEVALEAAKAVCHSADDFEYFWFAGKKSVARKMRQHFRDTVGYEGGNSYIVGFWEATKR